MSQQSEIRAVLEGPGSCPVVCGAAPARGFFEMTSTPQDLSHGVELDARQPRLLLPSDQLPAATIDVIVTIGQPDAAAVVAGDLPYTVHLRRPIEDGFVHELLLSGGDA